MKAGSAERCSAQRAGVALGLVLWSAWVLTTSCTALNSYETVPDGSAAHGATGAAGAGGGGHGGGGGGHGAATSGGGGVGGTGSGLGGTAGSGAGPSPCAHDLCQPGAPLEASCDGCVAGVCGPYPHCCADAWNTDCVVAAASLCAMTDCPNLCEYLFEQLPGFEQCVNPFEPCEFSAQPTGEGATCADICSAAGTECESASFDAAPCGIGDAVDCGDPVPMGNYLRCTCRFECASGPMCPPDQPCTSGGCPEPT